MSEIAGKVKNLDLLLRAAKAVVESVKSDKTVLGMGNWNDYRRWENTPARADVEKNYCGTSACFAGHMPFLGIPELAVQEEDWRNSNPQTLQYPDYLNRLFNIDHFSREFDWFFGPEMSNDVNLLLARVEYYCENLSVPDWKDGGWEDWGEVS